MPVRNANAVWNGTIREGDGTMALGSGAYEGEYSFGSRFEEAGGTNPEELIGAALAGCFSMALSAALGEAGYAAERIETDARVHLEQTNGGWTIRAIDLETDASVPGIDEKTFEEYAEASKVNCPVSQALKGGPEVRLKTTLES